MTRGLRVNNIAPVGERAADLIRGRTGSSAAGTTSIMGSEVGSFPSDGEVLVLDGATDTWDPRLLLGFAGAVISPSQLVANTDNWNPTGLATCSAIRVSTDASRNLTGVTAPAHARAIVLENVGSNPLVLKHDATSTSANRFYCPGSTDYTLGANAGVALAYDVTSSRWRVQASGSGSISGFATPAIVLGTAAAAGSAATVIRSDSTIVAFDGTAPVSQAIGDSAAVGSAAVAARRDHKHGMPSAATPSGGYGTAAAGSAATVLRSDAVLPKPTAADVDFSADNTTSDATTGHHGLLPKLDGSVSHVLRGDGTYGLVAAGTGVQFRGVQCRNSTTQTVSTATDTPMVLDTENYDTDAYHFTSAAALTGTVAKTSGSATIVGTGTSFTTELSVNQVITIPGTATEWLVVTAITDNTHITVSRNANNTASGQTATRRNEGVAIPSGLGGYYDLDASGLWDTNTSGARTIKFYTTGTDNLLSHVGIFHAASNVGNANNPNIFVGSTTNLSAGDVVAGIVRQSSGTDRTFGAASPAENSGALTVAFRGN